MTLSSANITALKSAFNAEDDSPIIQQIKSANSFFAEKFGLDPSHAVYLMPAFSYQPKDITTQWDTNATSLDPRVINGRSLISKLIKDFSAATDMTRVMNTLDSVVSNDSHLNHASNQADMALKIRCIAMLSAYRIELQAQEGLNADEVAGDLRTASTHALDSVLREQINKVLNDIGVVKEKTLTVIH